MFFRCDHWKVYKTKKDLKQLPPICLISLLSDRTCASVETTHSVLEPGLVGDREVREGMTFCMSYTQT